MERRYQLYMVWKKITYPLYRSVNFLWVSIRTKNSGACHNLLAFLQRRDASGVPIMKQVIGRFIHHKEPIPRSADPLFLELGFASPMTLHRAHKKTQEKRLFFFLVAEGMALFKMYQIYGNLVGGFNPFEKC